MPREFEYADSHILSPILLIADHASNHIPDEYERLGLEEKWLSHHIAYDIGTAALTRALAEKLNANAILATHSRLLVDLNRPLGHESLIPQISDSVFIPGNCDLTDDARAERIARFYTPYHDAISSKLLAMQRAQLSPILFSLHSFTPIMNGEARPWDCALLWNKDERLAPKAADLLEARGDLKVGRNQPYSGKILNHTMDLHAEAEGHPYATFEIRQDLIADETGVARWADILCNILCKLYPFGQTNR